MVFKKNLLILPLQQSKSLLLRMKELKDLKQDTDGMMTYDYLVNHVPECLGEMEIIVSNLLDRDSTGQFLSSSARFLASVDKDTFEPWISRLVVGAIDKDRERRYIWSLLKAIWGDDYEENNVELQNSDDNFRRIYKRIHPEKQSSLI